jgi:hypothetical protein
MIGRTAFRAMTFALLAQGGEWTAPVEVQHEHKTCIAYRAKWTGGVLVVEAAIAPGWHTFAMDNKQRQQEALAGKPSLGIELPTQITPADGLVMQGPWYQTAPKDFSKPEIRWYSWGFERQAVFAVKARSESSGPARIGIRAQACTESICKNVDVSLQVPRADTKAASGAHEVDLGSLTRVR